MRKKQPGPLTKSGIALALAKARRKMKAKARKEKQDEKEKRVYVRWLLFCKGRGKDKNLCQKDSLFINRHVHEAYDKYLLALEKGIDTRLTRTPIKRNPDFPPSFKTYRRIWYGGSKFNYIKFDVPNLMKMKWEELQSAMRDTEVRKQREGQWMLELRREIMLQVQSQSESDQSGVVPSLSIAIHKKVQGYERSSRTDKGIPEGISQEESGLTENQKHEAILREPRRGKVSEEAAVLGKS
jgi:hypothetical protein